MWVFILAGMAGRQRRLCWTHNKDQKAPNLVIRVASNGGSCILGAVRV